jgi:hypothetical protein
MTPWMLEGASRRIFPASLGHPCNAGTATRDIRTDARDARQRKRPKSESSSTSTKSLCCERYA